MDFNTKGTQNWNTISTQKHKTVCIHFISNKNWFINRFSIFEWFCVVVLCVCVVFFFPSDDSIPFAQKCEWWAQETMFRLIFSIIIHGSSDRMVHRRSQALEFFFISICPLMNSAVLNEIKMKNRRRKRERVIRYQATMCVCQYKFLFHDDKTKGFGPFSNQWVSTFLWMPWHYIILSMTLHWHMGHIRISIIHTLFYQPSTDSTFVCNPFIYFAVQIKIFFCILIYWQRFRKPITKFTMLDRNKYNISHKCHLPVRTCDCVFLSFVFFVRSLVGCKRVKAVIQQFSMRSKTSAFNHLN